MTPRWCGRSAARWLGRWGGLVDLVAHIVAESRRGAPKTFPAPRVGEWSLPGRTDVRTLDISSVHTPERRAATRMTRASAALPRRTRAVARLARQIRRR